MCAVMTYLLMLGIATAGCLIWSLVRGEDMFKDDHRENALLGGTPEARLTRRNAFVNARNNGSEKADARRIAHVAYEDALPPEMREGFKNEAE